MRLLEYESKEIYKKFEIPVLNGIVITREDEFYSKLQEIKFPAIIKSQIAISGRKKAGLIKIAYSEKEALDLCNLFFQKVVKGYKVEAILIEEITQIKHEYYFSICLNASERQFYLLASREGGIDIETVAVEHPESIIKRNFTVSQGLSENLAKQVFEELGLDEKIREETIDLLLKMWKLTKKSDAILVEINPLALTPSGLIALDAKMELDDNAAFRNTIIKNLQSKNYSDFEKYANENNLFFVELNGEIGVLGNGAGLTLELVDILTEMGLKPANFLDLGGGAKPERVYKAIELITRLNPKAILINIFGGITRCDFIAKGIVKAIKKIKDPPPMVIRLKGTKHLEGIKILENEGVNAFKDLTIAVEEIKKI